MTNELIAKAKECKSAEELLALAKENGIELTAEEAAERFASLNIEGEISDEELDAASGGACHTKVDGQSYTVVTNHCKCFTGEYEPGVEYYREQTYSSTDNGVRKRILRQDHTSLRNTWSGGCSDNECGYCLHLEFKGGTGYCGKSGN